MKEDVEEHSICEGDMLLAKGGIYPPNKWLVLERLPSGDYKYLLYCNSKSYFMIEDCRGFTTTNFELVR